MSLSANPCAAGNDPFLGEIDTFAFTFCPVNWVPLNGQLLKISSNIALFSLLGTTYDGDGTTAFALPAGKPVITLTPCAPVMQCRDRKARLDPAAGDKIFARMRICHPLQLRLAGRSRRFDRAAKKACSGMNLDH